MSDQVTCLATPADVEVWAAQSSYTQAGPRAGVPTPATGQVSMALAARGDQTAGSSIDIQTSRGGYPGRDGATMLWRATGASSWYGWDFPQAIQSWESPFWTDASGNLKFLRQPCAITLGNGTVLVACYVRDATYLATTGEYRVEVLIRSPTAATWSRVLVYGEDGAPPADFCPCLVVLESGRILCYHLMFDEVATVGAIRMWYSDDSGATWSYGGDVSPTAGEVPYTTLTPTRMRAAYKDGQILLIRCDTYVSGAVTIRDRITQFASADLGNSFEVVRSLWSPEDAAGAAYSGRYAEVMATDLGFLVVYGIADAIAVLVADAYTDIDRAERVAVGFSSSIVSGGGTGTTAIADGDMALVKDDAGVLYAYARVVADGIGCMAFSEDNGRTWQIPGTPIMDGEWWQGLSTADYPAKITATWHRGRVLVVGNWVASTGNEDDSIGVWSLGGYSTRPMLPLKIARATDDRGAWNITWVPIEEPNDAGWTATGTAASEDLTSAGHVLTVAAAQTRYYSTAPTLTPSTPLLVRFRCTTSAGSVTTNRIAVRVQWSDGVVGYGVDIRIASTGYRVYDGIAGTVIGSTQTVAFSAGAEVIVAMYGDEVYVYHRAVAVTDEARSWTAGPTSTGLTDGGAIADFIRFGVQATSATDDTVTWHGMYVAHSNYAGQPWTRASYPNDLHGRAYSSRWVYVGSGVSVSSRGSRPTVVGDQWTIATRYDYELRRALEIGSPRQTWRSTSTDAQVIALAWDADDVADTYPESRMLAIPLLNSNVSRVQVAFYDDSGAGTWVGTQTIDLVTGLTGLSLSTAGRVSRPGASAGTSVPMLRAGEWKGSTLHIDSTYSRRIVDNNGGPWRYEVRPRPTLVLDEGGVTAEVTTGAIIPAYAVLIIDVPAAYRGVRITIPAAASQAAKPAEAYYEIGYLRPMWLRPIGRPHDWGRRQSLAAATLLAEARDRTRSARLAAPVQRTLEVGWTDGVDQTREEEVDGGIPESVIVGEADASMSGVAWQLGAVLRRHAEDPILYLEGVPQKLGSQHIINRRDRILLARIEGDIAIDTAQGTGDYDEIVRVGPITLVEEV